MKTRHVRMFLEDPDEGKLTAHLSYEEDSVGLTLYDGNDSIYIGSYIGYGQTQKELKARAKNEKEKWSKLLNIAQEAADRTSVMFANAIEQKDKPEVDKVIEKAKRRVKKLLKQDAD